MDNDATLTMGEVANAKRLLVVCWSLLAVVILGGIAVPGRVLPAVVFLVVLGAFFRSMVRARRMLPERLASHFRFGLEPDGWMSRQAYFVLMAGLAGVVGVVLPLGMFLAAEQAGDAKMQRLALWLMPLILGLLLGVNELLVNANEREPVMLSRWIWALMGVFLLAINAWALSVVLPW